ncbi:MAG: magnesium transporter CorA family protein [Candidatus Kerfeldbacteria bacterium]|nr:magnesium transporter CorA family protein [Candidatus Kerfeldbacteria bacterium]
MALREVKTSTVRWIHVENPTQEDVNALKEEFDFHPLDLSDAMSKTQRPKIDVYDDYLFMVLHLPVFHLKTRKVDTQEVNLFLGQGYIVTMTDQAFPVLEGMFSSCSTDKDFQKSFMHRGSSYLLYRIIHPLFRDVFSVVDKVGEYLHALENRIYSEEQTVSSLREIATIQRMLLRLRATIDPQANIIGQLVTLKRSYLGKEADVYFDDVHDHVERISAFLSNQKDLLQSLYQMNESLISHRTGEVMKMLTLISASLLPLTLITGVYGMNIRGLPFADHPLAFLITVGFLFIVLATIIIFFRRKNWV